MSSFEAARQRERGYHAAFYAKHTLGDENTWLVGPSPYVINSFQYLPRAKNLRALDLGAGIGRHAFSFIERFGPASKVVCVDMLEFAIERLQELSRQRNMAENIVPLVSDIADYKPEGTFDYILSVSVIEHLPSPESLATCLKRLQRATNPRGVHCFMIATDHHWTVKSTGKATEPIVEQNLSLANAQKLLLELYKDWDIKDISTKDWEQIESVDGEDVICASTCVQFIAVKTGKE